MVRSKFPGKPSKLINRKLTRASTASAIQENEATKTAEDINHGLKIFKGIFGFDEEDKGTEFRGFSPHEVHVARDKSRIRHIQVEEEYKARGVLYEPHSTGKTTLLPACFVNIKPIYCGRKSYNQKTSEESRLSDKKPNEPSSSSSVGKADILPVFKAPVTDSSKENRFVRTNRCNAFKVRPSIPDTQDKGGGDNKKKFVLPSRSVHSSRVIKPNKRFLDTDLNIGSSGTSDNNDAVYAGIKLKKAKLVVNPLNENSAFTWCNNKVRKEGASSSVSGDEVINNPNETRSSDSVSSGSNENPPDNNSSASAITTSSTTTITTTTTTTTATSVSTTTTTITTATVTSQPGPAGGKVIIRKARLKIDNELPSLKGPFSEKFENPKHAPGTVVCGVCGAVRFYRFVKQTRKFGIYSCEACRKFISRMIRETYVSSPLQCLQGDGKCVVPLIMTTLKWTSTRNRIPRCEACWLKMCLQCYCMPEDLRDRLTEKLPKSMQEDFKLELSSKPKSIPKLEPKDKDVLSGDETSTSRQRRRAAINSLVNIARFTGRVADETVENQLLIARNLKKKATAMMRREVQMNCTSKKDLVRISEDILIKNVKADSKRGLSKNANGDFKTSGVMSAKENLNSGVISMADPQKKKKRKLKNDEKTGRRQRINIKGPRVKHVCRSASLVLGQPVATFNSVSPLKNKANATKELDGELTMSVLPAVMETSPNADITEMVNGKPTEHSCMRMRQPCDLSLHKEEPPPAKASRALSNQSKPLARTLQDLGRQNCELLDGVAETHESAVVSIDFWESYDPEEVCKTGFALIGSDASFKARALCFLCGSAGQDRLIHCACCCEPYHQYCVEGGDCNKTEDKDWWRVDWVCPRCTLCNACGLGSGPQLSCQRCHKSYHTECLAADRLANRLHSADRPWVCPSCLRCKSCNVAAVYKFVGNLPLCRGCFKLRQRGNFCPLCQRCYEDNDFDTKMMECSQCKCWVHAKCEGLSNEKYQVLSFLPESVEFVCRMCCEMPPAPWWLAVEAEMKVGYLSVLKALSKNRKACDLLKWSPKKQSPICVCHGGARQRTLRFPELSEQSDAESSDLRTSCDTQRDEEVLSNEDECLQKSVKQNSLDSENSVILVSESKDLSVDERTSGLCELRLKYRDGPVLRPNAEEELHLKLDSDTQLLNIPYQNIDGKTAQFSPHATSQSDSGIASTDDELKSTTAEQCFCLGLDPWTKTSPTLLTVKKKVNSNEYSSLLQFHQEMQHVISSVKGLELLDLYYQTLQDVFPWFDPKCSQVYDSRKESSIAQTEFDESTESVNNERTENCDEDVSVVLRNLLNLSEDYYYSDFSASDIRVCVLCKTVGEGKATYEGRLLYCGHNEWVHANCALWSNEVFEEIDGSLQNVHSAVSRSRHIRCSGCGKKGASVGCCNRNCPEAYHFPCARAGRCVFMENKTVYCLAHQSEADDSKPLVDDSDYPVSRPVYVELERKKKKFVPRQDVRLMVGSLTVESIGEFVPDVSDQENTILPCEFYCTRLYWSSLEPWRVVKYHIRTKVIHSTLEYSTENDFNYTVDHSLDDHVIPKNGEKLLPAKEVVIREVNENDVRQVLENIIEIICSREDEGCLSDPQNSADLLPPELKDAIFEDIPHDLLDGISMQDIFPKLMSYDDISVDTKGDKEYKSDSNSDIESLHTYSSKKTKYDSYENSVENNLYKNLNHVTKTYSVQSEEKRKYSKRYFNRRRNCDRSSNELISEGNAENKIEEKENTVKWQRPQILQVDGAGDCSSESDTGSPSNEDFCCTPVLHVTIQESQHTAGKISSPIGISSKSEHCIWQVDGTADFSSSSSSSESGSPLREEDCNWKLIEQLDGQVDCSSSEEGEEKPVKCAQCHRTYRTAQSYERHLQTCSVDYILSCSESDSSEEEKINSPIAEVVENDILAPNTLYTVSEAKSVSEDGSLQMSLPEIRECAPTLPETVSDCKMDINCIPFGTLYSQVDEMQTTAYPENSESQNCRNGNDVSDNFTNVNCVYSEQNCHKINGLIHSNVETIVTNNALPNRICQYKPKTIRTVSENFEYSNGASLSLSPKTSPIRNRTPRTYTRRKKGITTVTPVITSPVTTSQHQIIEYQPTAVSGAPALILHQVPTQNVIPAYVDASYTQQSSAHNIQYIATIDPQDKTQYLATNPIIPATYHLQTTPLGIQSVVPTVVGTIIQPNGVEQLVVNAPTPAVEVISQNPTSGMFIASPPMYVGMETVVSNTVMSSSQFVSGMLAASSYSATTTQVFQTAKPVMDLAQGYVIVNTQPSPAPTAIPQTQTMFQPPAQTPFPWSCNYQEAYKFKERTTYQAVTRQIIREEKKVDCLQMVNATQKTIVIEQPVSEKVEIKSEPPRFAEQKSPVHELSKMVDNFCVKKQVTTQKRKCTGVSLDIVKCPPVAAQVNQKVFNEVSQNVSKPLCGDSKKNPIVMKEITLPPVLALKQEKLKTEPNKTESENKEVNGKKQIHSEVLNKNNNERNTSQITLKTNKYIEMSRFPLRENKIIKRTLELKPRKINTLVKNSSSPKIIYEINSQDGFTTSSSCLVEAWQKVFEAVQAARAEKRLPPLPQNPFVSDLRTLGLDNNSVKYLVEQLPGVGHCVKYKPVYHKPRIPVLGDHMAAPQENVTGCARSEPFRIRNKYDMFSWLASRHRRPPKLLVNSDSDIVNGNSRRATSLNLPMAMRFRHLKETSRESVGVFRSDIHGRGLFCLRDIDSGEMVIEYAGEVVRSGLTDKRERYYTSKGIGCYMFRIDDQFVVDATMRGNAARFINHSCEPNCYSRVVDILGKKHILIFALRRIPQGEELTYDYKFPLEDDKITCHCLSRKCRKYLN